ncbi:MAG: hypothetical protein OHK0039_04380 [Bacteroidia bacterium]
MPDWIQTLKELLLEDVRPLGGQHPASLPFAAGEPDWMADLYEAQAHLRDRVWPLLATDPGGSFALAPLHLLTGLLMLGTDQQADTTPAERCRTLLAGVPETWRSQQLLWYHLDMSPARERREAARLFFRSTWRALDFRDPAAPVQVQQTLADFLGVPVAWPAALPGHMHYAQLFRLHGRTRADHPVVWRDFDAGAGRRENQPFCCIEGNFEVATPASGVCVRLPLGELRLWLYLPATTGTQPLPGGLAWTTRPLRLYLPANPWLFQTHLRTPLEAVGLGGCFAAADRPGDPGDHLDSWLQCGSIDVAAALRGTYLLRGHPPESYAFDRPFAFRISAADRDQGLLDGWRAGG